MSSTGSTRPATDPDLDAEVVEVVDDDAPPPPGRPVRLVPTPSGFWRLVGGVIVAMLAPFFGILIGSTLGSSQVDSRMDPLYWGFMIGCVIGGLALVVAGFGARELWRNARTEEAP